MLRSAWRVSVESEASCRSTKIDGWIANQELLPRTPHTIVHPVSLRNEVARVRQQQGWASVDQEFEFGLRSAGVSLKNYRGERCGGQHQRAHCAHDTGQLVRGPACRRCCNRRRS